MDDEEGLDFERNNRSRATLSYLHNAILPISIEQPAIEAPALILPSHPPGRNPQAEFGVSHLFFLIAFADGDDVEEDPLDEIIFNSKYQNFNFNARKWINPNWSVQTGMFLSRLDADIDFSVFFNVDDNDLEEIAKLEFREAAIKGEASERSEISINFMNDPVISPGDAINLSGAVELRLNALQIPVFIHRHWYKNRSEFIAGGGITLEHIWGFQTGSDFQLKTLESRVLEATISQEKIEESYFDASIYLEGGWRYYLNDNWNIGLTARIAAIQPIFSGLEVGINYRIF